MKSACGNKGDSENGVPPSPRLFAADSGKHSATEPKYEDRPKLLGQPDALSARLGEIELPHIAPLTAFVRKLRSDVGPAASIPFFDPWDGGTNAEILFLLEAPGPKARNSGFVSRNNPDETAKNLFLLLNEAALPRKASILWNVVPWYIGTGSRIRAAKASDVSSGVESLNELLGLLPRLRGVVLLGRKAQRAEEHVRLLKPSVFVQRCPHPSPMFVNRKPENREVLLNHIKSVKLHMENANSPEG